MRQGRNRRSRCRGRQPELAFRQLFWQWSAAERQRLVEELAQPFQRQWLIVDAHGLKRLK